jgi:hypothetical protein
MTDRSDRAGGDVVVPREPTDEMIVAALEWSLEWMRGHKVDGLSPFKDYPPVKETTAGMYRAMLAASPPSGDAGEGVGDDIVRKAAGEPVNALLAMTSGEKRSFIEPPFDRPFQPAPDAEEPLPWDDGASRGTPRTLPKGAPQPAPDTEPDCGYPAKVAELTAALDETTRQCQHWKELAKAAQPAPDALREAMREACDLLAERKYGNPARSAGHNARLCLESALARSQPRDPKAPDQ